MRILKQASLPVNAYNQEAGQPSQNQEKKKNAFQPGSKATGGARRFGEARWYLYGRRNLGGILEKQKLLSLTRKDFEISTFSSGKGGQHQNRHNNFVRIYHPPTKLSMIGTSSKSQTQNREDAFKRLVNHPKFRAWLRVESCKAAGLINDVETEIDKSLSDPNNLRIEGHDDKGRWVKIDECSDEEQ